MSDKVWLITGASSGFGRHVAERVLETGGRVVATARDPSTLVDLAKDGGDRVLTLAADVTDRSALDRAVGEGLRSFGRIDALHNNAGYGSFGAVEEVPAEAVGRAFDVNVFGALAAMRAVLPAMRRQRSGHILNMSSLAGQRARAGYGIYAATKFALEALSESLAQEVAPLGIRVTIVEPSGFRTDFNGRSLSVVRKDQRIADYKATAGDFQDQAEAFDNRQPGDPRKAAEAMVAIVDRENPPLRLPLGRAAVNAIREKLEMVRIDVDAGERLAADADFPGAAPA